MSEERLQNKNNLLMIIDVMDDDFFITIILTAALLFCVICQLQMRGFMKWITHLLIAMNDNNTLTKLLYATY